MCKVLDDGRRAVVFPPDLRFYDLYRSGYLETRFDPVREMLGWPEFGYTNKELMEIVLGHELGHAAEDLDGKRLRRFLGLEPIGADISGYNTLPLGMPSTDAEDLWNGDHGGYRSDVMAGHTHSSFQQILRVNMEAFRELPGEKAADRFAATCIAIAYAD
jgi:hypothetical protein